MEVMLSNNVTYELLFRIICAMTANPHWDLARYDVEGRHVVDPDNYISDEER